MALSAISQQMLQQIETRTGLPIRVGEDARLKPPSLARIQLARGAGAFHQLVLHPNAGAMGDYQVAHQCSFILRHYSIPSSDRRTLAASNVARTESLDWVKQVPGCERMDSDQLSRYSEFLQHGLLNMLRSTPVGMRIDRELRSRIPELHAPQQQAMRQQLDEHVTLLRPEIQKTIPPAALQLNLKVNAAYARFCAIELDQPELMKPYLAAGEEPIDESLFRIWQDANPDPKEDQALIQAWADHLGLGRWIEWRQ